MYSLLLVMCRETPAEQCKETVYILMDMHQTWCHEVGESTRVHKQRQQWIWRKSIFIDSLMWSYCQLSSVALVGSAHVRDT